MPQGSSPTLSRRALAARLRELRLAANLTVEEVAALLFVSSAKVSRMETGARPVTSRDVAGLSSIYELPDAEREQLFELSQSSRQAEWWTKLDLPGFNEYVGLEAAASAIHDMQVGFIPPLLQTEQYARALITGMAPYLSREDVELRVKTRALRQQRLVTQRVPVYEALIDEAALRRVVGGAEVMTEQLDHLRERAELNNISMRIVTLATGPHPGLNSPFVLLSFEDERVSDVVYVEGLQGHLYIDRDVDLQRYREAYERILKVALSVTDSLALISSIQYG